MPLALSWQHTGSLRACLVAWGRVLGPSRSPFLLAPVLFPSVES